MKETVFLVSNSYTCKTILPYLNYIINKEIGIVYILDEYNYSNDFYNRQYGHTVILTQNYEKCISESNIILVFDNGKIKQSLIDKIVLMSKNENKEVSIITDIFEDNSYHFGEDNVIINTSCIPSILLISFGDYNQQFITEIMLNKFFEQRKLSFLQLFSLKTMSVLRSLSNNFSLNPGITNSIHRTPDNCSLIINAIESSIFDYSIQTSNLSRIINEMSPDYLIVNTNARVEYDIERLFQDFYVRFGKEIDRMIISQYIPTYFWSNNTTPLFLRYNLKDDNNRVLMLDEEKANIQLQNDILMKMAIPSNVMLI